jgi:hypothetical protein
MSAETDLEQLRKWLMQQPRPHSVRVTSLDGGVHDVVCGTPWTNCADTVASLNPEHLQALNPEKQTIRALRVTDLSQDWSPDDQPAVRRPPPPPSPDYGIPAAAMDPESARFVLFSRLISEAYKHSTQVAFEKLSDIVEAMNRRAEAGDRAREAVNRAHVKMLEEQIKALGEEPAEQPNDLLSTIVSSALGGIMQGKAAAAAPKAAAPSSSNGKGQA